MLATNVRLQHNFKFCADDSSSVWSYFKLTLELHRSFRYDRIWKRTKMIKPINNYIHYVLQYPSHCRERGFCRLSERECSSCLCLILNGHYDNFRNTSSSCLTLVWLLMSWQFSEWNIFLIIIIVQTKSSYGLNPVKNEIFLTVNYFIDGLNYGLQLILSDCWA